MLGVFTFLEVSLISVRDDDGRPFILLVIFTIVFALQPLLLLLLLLFSVHSLSLSQTLLSLEMTLKKGCQLLGRCQHANIDIAKFIRAFVIIVIVVRVSRITKVLSTGPTRHGEGILPIRRQWLCTASARYSRTCRRRCRCGDGSSSEQGIKSEKCAGRRWQP